MFHQNHQYAGYMQVSYFSDVIEILTKLSERKGNACALDVHTPGFPSKLYFLLASQYITA